MEYNIQDVLNKFDAKQNLKYLFFWGHTPYSEYSVDKSCLSQWYKCSFVVDNITYNTAEQFMMSKKAMLFNDMQTFQRIMNANHPNEFKKLGREVKNFDEKRWEENRFNIVVEGNLAKFSQNDNLKYFLLSTKDRILVEASPYDTIWGIGLSAKSSNITNPHSWKGLNLLGFALMQVRDCILTGN